MSSQCTNDGTYTLTVTFKPGIDLNIAQVLVQNRVNLAEPVLPDLVKRRGVTVKKKSPNVLMIVNLFSPGRQLARQPVPEQLRHDPAPRRAGPAAGRRRHHLPRPARLLHAALARPGASWRPAACRRPTSSARSSSRTSRSPPGRSASRRRRRPGVPVHDNTLGRLTDPEQFADMILKTDDPTAGSSGCRTSAAIELGAQGYDQSCTLDGKPSVALSVYQLPGSNALDTAELVREQDGGTERRASRAASTTPSSTTPRRSSTNRSTRCSRRSATR